MILRGDVMLLGLSEIRPNEINGSYCASKAAIESVDVAWQDWVITPLRAITDSLPKKDARIDAARQYH